MNAFFLCEPDLHNVCNLWPTWETFSGCIGNPRRMSSQSIRNHFQLWQVGKSHSVWYLWPWIVVKLGRGLSDFIALPKKKANKKRNPKLSTAFAAHYNFRHKDRRWLNAIRFCVLAQLLEFPNCDWCLPFVTWLLDCLSANWPKTGAWAISVHLDWQTIKILASSPHLAAPLGTNWIIKCCTCYRCTMQWIFA